MRYKRNVVFLPVIGNFRLKPLISHFEVFPFLGFGAEGMNLKRGGGVRGYSRELKGYET